MVDFGGKSVAVVGSSNHLLQRDYATLIDGCDYVLRFNQARVVGYEDYVGHRTTHRIISIHNFLGAADKKNFSEYDESFFSRLEDQKLILREPMEWFRANAAVRNLKCPVTCLPKALNIKADKCIGASATTGFLGILAAMNSSDQVSVLGFDLEPTSKLRLPHYWETVTGGFPCHKFSVEREAIKRFEAEGKLRAHI